MITRDNKGAGVKPAPFFIICCLLTTVSANAEVPVVDIEDRESVTSVRATPPVSANTTVTYPSSVSSSPSSGSGKQNQLSEIFAQMQQLQHEVQELRGTVEQQNFEVQTLKQQVKDNYLDVDKRLSTLQANPSAASNIDSASDTSPAADLPASGAEKDSYDAAYKILDQGRKDDAIIAFRKHAALYPKGQYAPNAYYWMGQIYLSQSQLDLAQEQFVTLLKTFPDDRKTPDAKFALGKVYFQQGKKAEAKKLIQEVSSGNSKTAALAKTFLQDNF